MYLTTHACRVWLHAAGGAAGGGHTRMLTMLLSAASAPGQPQGLRQLAPWAQSTLLRAAVRACTLQLKTPGSTTAISTPRPAGPIATLPITTSPAPPVPIPTPTNPNCPPNATPVTPAISRTTSLVAPLPRTPPAPGSLLPLLLELCSLPPDPKPLPWEPPTTVDAGALSDALMQACQSNAAGVLGALVEAAGGGEVLRRVGGKLLVEAARAGHAETVEMLVGAR